MIVRSRAISSHALACNGASMGISSQFIPGIEKPSVKRAVCVCVPHGTFIHDGLCLLHIAGLEEWVKADKSIIHMKTGFCQY